MQACRERVCLRPGGAFRREMNIEMRGVTCCGFVGWPTTKARSGYGREINIALACYSSEFD